MPSPLPPEFLCPDVPTIGKMYDLVKWGTWHLIVCARCNHKTPILLTGQYPSVCDTCGWRFQFVDFVLARPVSIGQPIPFDGYGVRILGAPPALAPMEPTGSPV